MLKSLFLSFYILFLPVACAIHISSLAVFSDPLHWFAIVGLYFVPMLFFAGLVIIRPARTGQHLFVLQLLLVSAFLLQFFIFLKYQNAVGLILGGTALLGWECYLYWYSNLGEYRGIIGLGRDLPTFALGDSQGRRVFFKAQDGRPHLLFFIRGNWCPLCVAQIGEVKDRINELIASNVVVDIITAQDHDKNSKLAFKSGLDVRFWQDKNGEASKHLGLFHRWGVPFLLRFMGYTADSIVPAVVLIDRSGKVIWFEVAQNYRVRPTVDEYWERLKAITNPA